METPGTCAKRSFFSSRKKQKKERFRYFHVDEEMVMHKF